MNSVNGQCGRTSMTLRRMSWSPRISQCDISNIMEGFAAFPWLRIRFASPLFGLYAPVESVIDVDTLKCAASSLEFAWRRRDGVSIPPISGKIAVRRIAGIVRVFECAVEYDAPTDIATRAYDDVVGQRIVWALLERFTKIVMALADARAPGKVVMR